MYRGVSNGIYYFLSVMVVVNGRPQAPSERIVEALDHATEFSSTVQKTYQHDISLKKPSVIGSPLFGHTGVPQFYPLIGNLGSPHATGGGPSIIVTQHVGHQHAVSVAPAGATAGIVLPAEEEKHHLYREELENLSKTPLLGPAGEITAVGLVQRDNTEKMFRKSSVSKPVISGAVAGSVLAG